MSEIRYMISVALFAMVAILGVLGITGHAAHAEGYVLIVNTGNSISGDETEMKENIKRIYMKAQTKWPDGAKAVAFARDSKDPAHSAFVTNVLGMTLGELDKHWARLKQTAGKTPPRAIESGRILMRQIGKNEGAFSYAPADAKLPDNVKVLFNF